MTNAWEGVDLLVLTDLPERLDNRLLAVVQAIADLPSPPMVPVDERHFNQSMRTLSILPYRDDGDALTAKLRLALYRKHFGHYPVEAWSFLVEHATLECRFFPTPSECKAILDRWSRQDGPWRAHQLARRAASRELEARLVDLLMRFAEGKVEQAEVDALPERWKRIAATQGYLWEGTFKLRPVRRYPGEEEQEGQGPAVLREQDTRGDGKTRQPHERTAP